MSRRPSLREMPMAMMPSSGMPTAVTSMPISAGTTCVPAFAPMMMGKIRLPAPKKSPKSIDAIIV